MMSINSRAFAKRVARTFGVINKVMGYVYYRQARHCLHNDNSWINLQRKQLADMLNYCRKNVPAYSTIGEVSSENSMEILSHIHLSNKSVIRSRPQEFYSKEIGKNWSNWANTGGSTGEPFRFPVLFKGKHIEAIHQMMLYIMMGYKWGDTIISVDGVRVEDEKIKRNVYWARNENFQYGKFRLSCIYMSDDTLDYYIDFLNKAQPQFIRGYPSGIMTICRYIEKRKITPLFQLKGIYLTSENFGIQERLYIKEIMGCDVWGQYGHTESSVFGVMRPDSDSYLCSPLYGITEILDEKGRAVGGGMIGEIVVTGFTNYACPFVRYQTGDLAINGGLNDKGCVIIKQILGRSSDYVINSKHERIYLVGFIFGGHLSVFNKVVQWQIEQNVSGHITVKIVKDDNFDISVEEEIVKLFKSKDITAEIEYVDKIVKTSRGKVQFMIQNIKSGRDE